MNNISSLYIHIPFCEHLCDYCDFPKLQYFRTFAEKYIKELKDELSSYDIQKPLKTIYVGGGTPTSLDDDLFLELLETLDQYRDGVEEYTIECNPESLSVNKLKMMKDHGVNRLSIGVESTNDEILRLINRHHTYEDVKSAVKNARNAGFRNINVDLILGLPHSSIHQLESDLNNLLSLDIQHISCYSLTVNPHTVFDIKGIKAPPDDVLRELYDVVENKLKENGFIHYEISNWCKPGLYSRHNLTYWKDEQYYGIGMGAAGYIGYKRYRNTLSINEYLHHHYIDEEEIVNNSEDKTYYLMLNLRTIFGLNLLDYQGKFHENLLKKKKKSIDKFINDGLLKLEDDALIPTYEGMMVEDLIVLELIS